MAKPHGVQLDLLEYLSYRSGCVCLSDLRQPQARCIIAHTLMELDPEQFPLWEWNDAIAYLTQDHHTYETAEQGWRALLYAVSTEGENGKVK